jgi:ATP-dependent Lon protease
MKMVLIPFQNKKDLEDIPAEILKKVKIVPVSEIGEALKLALEKYPPPVPKAADKEEKEQTVPAAKAAAKPAKGSSARA